MDVLITRQNGDQRLLSDIGVVARDFAVKSPEMRAEYADIEGRAGSIDAGFTHGRREIVVPFYYKAQDNADYALLRDELFRLAAHGEPFYIREMRRTVRNQGDSLLIGGKRYYVRLAGAIEPEQTQDYGFGELTFETVRLPYAESVGTTADIQASGIADDPALWGYGMGLIAEDGALKYTHTGRSFRIYNAGDVAVLPFGYDLRIDITGAANAGNNFALTNVTTGDVFALKDRVLAPSDVLTLAGPVVTINNAAALRQTNRGIITLAPGWNDFTISGADSATVAFDFRFYYL